jgi:hypothetical protein
LARSLPARHIPETAANDPWSSTFLIFKPASYQYLMFVQNFKTGTGEPRSMVPSGLPNLSAPRSCCTVERDGYPHHGAFRSEGCCCSTVIAALLLLLLLLPSAENLNWAAKRNESGLISTGPRRDGDNPWYWKRLAAGTASVTDSCRWHPPGCVRLQPQCRRRQTVGQRRQVITSYSLSCSWICRVEISACSGWSGRKKC